MKNPEPSNDAATPDSLEPSDTYTQTLKRLRGKYKSEVSATTELLQERRQEVELKGH